MIIPDLNLLVYAHNAADQRHVVAREWGEDGLNGSEPVGLAWVTRLGFVRLTTPGQVLVSPLPVATAVGMAEDWLDQPIVRMLVPGWDHAHPVLGF